MRQQECSAGEALPSNTQGTDNHTVCATPGLTGATSYSESRR
jgi:hypothetical protein